MQAVFLFPIFKILETKNSPFGEFLVYFYCGKFCKFTSPASGSIPSISKVEFFSQEEQQADKP